MVVQKLGPFDKSSPSNFLGEATLCTDTIVPPARRTQLNADAPTSATPMPAPVQNFVGVTNKEQTKVLPPPTRDLVHEDGASDTSGAVGPNDYLEVVNDAVEVFTKDGALRCGPYENDYWWHGTTCEVDGVLTDAVVEYDAQAGRWFAAHFGGEGRVCVAVSQTSDPAAGYWLYVFPIRISDPPIDFAGDYPKFGIWPDAYYYVSNARTQAGGGLDGFNGVYVAAFDRAAMLCGAPCVETQPVGDVEYFLQLTKDGAQATYESLPFTLLPTNLEGRLPPPEGAPNPMVQSSSAATGNSVTIWDFHVDFADPSASTFEPEPPLPTEPYTSPCGVNAAGYINPDCVVQPLAPGSTERRPLDALARYLMNRGVYRNFGDHASLLADQTVGTGVTLSEGSPQTGIRWYEFRSQGLDPWVVYQHGTHAPDAVHDRWLGSMTIDAGGNIAIAYNMSGGATLAPSVAYAGRLAGDPAGQLPRGEVVAVHGKGVQTGGGEFGDYSQMTLDPDDDCTFWYAGEFYSSQEDASATKPLWSTSVTAFRFPSCPASGRAAGAGFAGAPTVGGSGSRRPALAATGRPSDLGAGAMLMFAGMALLSLTRAAPVCERRSRSDRSR